MRKKSNKEYSESNLLPDNTSGSELYRLYRTTIFLNKTKSLYNLVTKNCKLPARETHQVKGIKSGIFLLAKVFSYLQFSEFFEKQ